MTMITLIFTLSPNWKDWWLLRRKILKVGMWSRIYDSKTPTPYSRKD